MSGSKKKGTTTIEPERMAAVVLDAELLGNCRAAKEHRVSDDTVRAYRKRILGCPEALDILRAKKKDIEARWRTARVNFLLRAVARLDELLPQLKADQVRDIVGAVKILGELHTTQQVLTDDLTNERDASRPPSPPAAPPATDGDRGEEPAPLH